MPQEPVPLSDEHVRGDEEYVRLETLKKTKLQITDRMQAIARRQRGAAAHP